MQAYLLHEHWFYLPLFIIYNLAKINFLELISVIRGINTAKPDTGVI